MNNNVIRRLFPQASGTFIALNGKVSHPKSQPNQTMALDSPVPGKTKSVDRVVLRFTGFRVRPLDPDNFAASIKDLCDAIVHCHLIPNDTIRDIILETAQVKIGSWGEERTLIEIVYPK